MTGDEALEAVRRHFESLFPKTCPSCGRRFDTLRDYISSTERLGVAKSYDAEIGDWNTTNPIGSTALSNCPCGSTLALTTDGMALQERQAMLGWIRAEIERRGVTASDVLESLRDELREQVLGESGSE